MRYLILGNGWLANILKNYLGNEARIYQGRFYPYDIGGHIFQDYDVMINTIAKTNIDWCEKNKWQAFEDNAMLAYYLAERAKEDNTKYVFFSSACIFESQNKEDIKYEDSIPNPQCWYAWTKAMAEQLILEVNPDALIIRPRLPLSEVPHPRNTINKLLTYKFLNDNQESVTVVEDMLPVLKNLMEKEKGVFHLINEGTVSPADIGFLMDHNFNTWKKEEQNKKFKEEGRAKRVTTYVGSKRIPLLPNIEKRLPEIIKKYKEYEMKI